MRKTETEIQEEIINLLNGRTYESITKILQEVKYVLQKAIKEEKCDLKTTMEVISKQRQVILETCQDLGMLSIAPD